MSKKLLNKDTVTGNLEAFGLNEELLHLPEKVLQFGTGVLLRGLVDYLVDKANKKNIFNGTVVVVKSTGNSVSEFTDQDNLYTVIEKGVVQGQTMEQKNLITCISRVLPAQESWSEILQCAEDPAIEIVVSNTTEAGLVYMEEQLGDQAPASFPAKLTAYLWRRFTAFDGNSDKGLVILPTELVSNNGNLLKQFVLQQAANNNLPEAFSKWIDTANHFCNTLVDRIVPGKSEKDDLVNWNDDSINFTDHLHTTAEPFLLWAIEGGTDVREKLSFADADDRVVVAENIDGFKEQKLRILNGSNTIVVAPGFLAGCNTTADTVTDELFAAFTRRVIDNEIIPTIIESCPNASAFASQVLDRFSNPFVQYPLLNVALQCSGKMNSRNGATIVRYYRQFNQFPPLMSIGFAAFFLFYTPASIDDSGYCGLRDEQPYRYRDEHTQFLCSTLHGLNWNDTYTASKAVATILENEDIFSADLASLPGLADMLAEVCSRLENDGIRETITKALEQSHTA